MTAELFMTITLDFPTNRLSYKGNVKEEQVKDLVSKFLRLQIGKGADDSKTNEIDLYEITIFLDLSFDNFSCKHNCGNLGLRDGILMSFLNKWKPKKVK